MSCEQLNLFEFVLDNYKINKPIRLIELFSGIGAQAKALENLGVKFESWKTCDWAIPSIHAYVAIHNHFLPEEDQHAVWPTYDRKVKELMVAGVSSNYNNPINEKTIQKKSDEWINSLLHSIVKSNNMINIMDIHANDLEIINRDKYCYVMTYSFPCQDLSLAGNKKGMSISQADGGTRSGLLWEVERILKEASAEDCLPQVLLMENVAEIISYRNVRDFRKWCEVLESLGYTSFCEILNAKDYGIPQNRKRCFMVSVLGKHNYTFPKKINLKYTLKDFLEEKVNEKYFLSEKMINYISATGTKDFSVNNSKINCSIARPLTTEQNKRAGTTNYISNQFPEEFDLRKLAIKNATKQGYSFAEENDGIDISGRMEHHRGTVQHQSCQTITCMGGDNVGVVVSLPTNLSVRKLTPLECLKLMGFEECDYKALRDIGQTDSQIYHEAGDSIVVTVLMAIFGKLCGVDYESIIKKYVDTLIEKEGN